MIYPPRCIMIYPPTVLMISPTVLNTPTVLKISPHGTHDGTPPTVLNTPHGTAHTLYRVQTSLSVGYSRSLQPYNISTFVWEHLPIQNNHVLYQLLLLFEFRGYNRICLFRLNSFSLCIVIILSGGGGGGGMRCRILLFRTHHKSILSMETFFERLNGRGLHGNISLSNSQIFKLRNCQKNLSPSLKNFTVHIK